MSEWKVPTRTQESRTQNQNQPLSARDVNKKNYGRLKKKERRTVKKEEGEERKGKREAE